MHHRAVRGRTAVAHLGLCAVFALRDVQICCHRNRPRLTSIRGRVIPRRIQLSNPQETLSLHSVDVQSCTSVFHQPGCTGRHSAKSNIGPLHQAFSRCFSNHVFWMWHVPFWSQHEEFGAAPLPTFLSPIH